MARVLSESYADWERWAADADTSEPGWQANYPAWSSLIGLAVATLTAPPLTDAARDDIERCWVISEETGELASSAEERIDQCWELLSQLARSGSATVRWQVYTVLPRARQRAEPLLRAGLDDPDPYCRRRALFGLLPLQPPDARQLAERFLHDTVPYLRQAAIRMAYISRDPQFIDRVEELQRTGRLNDEDQADYAHEQEHLTRRTLCPACGYDLGFEPWIWDSSSHGVCPSCHIEYGYDDVLDGEPGWNARRRAHRSWCTRWIGHGMQWSSTAQPPPSGWNPRKQLHRIGVHLPATN